MRRRTRKTLTGLIACVLAALSLVLGSASPAAAFGAETFGCRIAPGTVFTWSTSCTTSKAASTYNVGFAVLNPSGTYTYAWNISGPYQSVIEGCTSSSYDCAVAVTIRTGQEKDITGTVTYTQGGQSSTKTAYATVVAYGGP